MAFMIVTFEVRPDSTEVDLKKLTVKIKSILENKGAFFKDDRTEIKPLVFGLKALFITFSVNEDKGTDEFENAVSDLEEVSSVTTVSMSRAMG